MVIFKFQFSKNLPIQDVETLYYRLYDKAQILDDHIIMPKNSSISFDAYFNVISTKYFKYCNIDHPHIDISFSGNIVAEVILKEINGNETILATKIFSTNKKTTASIEFNNLSTNPLGFIYLKVTSHIDDSILFNAEFKCNTSPQNIKIGVAVCTFKNETYLFNNLKKINQFLNENQNIQDILHFFIVDNGKTIKKEDIPNEKFMLISNKNTGGSGGFTRGLKEIMKDKSFTHFLFMDDDVVFDPIILSKTVSILSILKEKYIKSSIGGGMINLAHNTIQHESGAFWNGITLKSNASNIDLSTTDALLQNEHNPQLDYNAWWYMCMPTSTVDEVGLPLDYIFIRGDDIEYGLRGIKNLIVINGIGLWHESFYSKYQGVYKYFVKRNFLIINARFPKKKNLFDCFSIYVKSVAMALVKHRYFEIDLIDKAYRDYLKGYKYIENIDPEKLLCELEKFLPTFIIADEFSQKNNIDLDAELKKTEKKDAKKLKQVLSLNSYLIPKKYYDKYAVVHMTIADPVSYYKVKKSIAYNPYDKTVFVCDIKKSKLFYGLNKIIKMFFLMLFKFRKAKKSYKIQPK